MSSLAPQEKKELSYERDRRNRFGQHAKASRRLIPLRKAKDKRAYRKRTNQIVAVDLVLGDGLGDDSVENRVAVVKRKKWSKVPDVPLKDAIKGKKEWRIRRYGRKKRKTVIGGKLASQTVSAGLNSFDVEDILKKKQAVEPTSIYPTAMVYPGKPVGACPSPLLPCGSHTLLD